MNDGATHLGLETIVRLAAARGTREIGVAEEGTKSWADFGAAVKAIRQQCVAQGVEAGAVVMISAEERLEFLAWFFGVARLGAIVVPLRRERQNEMELWRERFEIGWLVGNGRLTRVKQGANSPVAEGLFGELRRRGHAGLILATGGTTGTPKLVLHDLAALLATVPVKAGPPRRIMPLMRFDHIGGLDMAWRALAGGHVLVEPPPERTAEAVAAAVRRHRVEVLPATPSFLNLLLLAEAGLKGDLASLRTVPYGAEPMPAGLLARLRAALPRVEFVQRFGTSETGALPVADRGDGLVLRTDHPGFAWKIVAGELWINSPARALGYLAGDAGGFDEAGWFRTGDLAEQLPDGTVRILGRRKDLINVGGEKALPESIEGVLLGHPLVADVRVKGMPNPVLGQVVAAEIVWLGTERDAVAVKRQLHEFAATSLPKCHLPAVVRLVAAIDTTGNFKKSRT